jgi:hypothetical protein
MCVFFPNPDQFSFLLPRSVASLACYRRLKQRQVLPSVGPKGSKVYELHLTLSSPTECHADTDWHQLALLFATTSHSGGWRLELIRTNVRRV